MISKKPCILCVDDEPMNLRLLEEVLANRGFNIVRAEEGQKALKVIRERKIDAVLLDIMMPGIDGYEVCRRIKEDERYRNIPIILLSALNGLPNRIKGIEAGAEDFIVKPFDAEEVLARVTMLLKVKALNDKLNSAYDSMSDLTSIGEAVIRTFDPLTFDFEAKIDGIVRQVIRRSQDETDHPEMVLVGFPDAFAPDSAECGGSAGNDWQWLLYGDLTSRLRKESPKTDMHASLHLPEKGASRTLIYNETDLNHSKLHPLTEKLSRIVEETRAHGEQGTFTLVPSGFPVLNMVCYISAELCVFAINYGRTVTDYDASALKNLVMQTLFMRSISTQIREVEDAFAYTVQTLARAAEANDEDTGNHIVRVGEYAAALAKALGMPEGFVETIRLQAQMHDVGKIHIPPEILKKPGKLTREEFEQMKQHAVYGAKIIGNHPRLRLARSIALTHHEKWDGSGYPHGLQGCRIPIEGRIISLADQYDALRNARVYKPSFDHETVYRILLEGDGRTMPHHFDPRVLDGFKTTAVRFEEIYETLQDERLTPSDPSICPARSSNGKERDRAVEPLFLQRFLNR